uniref:DNA 5'-3' helicase n=1 Tax=Biomphalaria glabrata TaxID=6526 RepID=A0A2C9KWB4_BIOGL
MENKIVHASPELERAVLGHVITTKSLNGVFGYLNPSDFTDKRNEIIYQALTEIQQGFAENHLELVALISHLKDKKLLEKAGGHEYIASLIEEAALPANITKFIKTIEDKARLRKFTKDLEHIQLRLQNPSVTPDQMVDTVENQVLSSIRDVEIKGFEDSNSISTRVYSIIEKKAAGQAPSGIKTEFSDLDELTGGFQKGDLIILAARPSMGKTALALNLMANVAHRGEAVAFYSVEMGADQI